MPELHDPDPIARAPQRNPRRTLYVLHDEDYGFYVARPSNDQGDGTWSSELGAATLFDLTSALEAAYYLARNDNRDDCVPHIIEVIMEERTVVDLSLGQIWGS
jgi:hypothetical protein